MAEGVCAGVVVAESVGLAVEVEHDRSVEESVEHGCGDGGVAEDLAPGGDAAVGGQHDAGLEVALRDDLEQRGGGKRQIPKLVDLCRHPHRSIYAEPATMPRSRPRGA